jgi:hypothetical protein
VPVIQDEVSVGASSTVANVIAGSIYEYLPFNALVEVAVAQQSGNIGDVRVTVNSGPDTLMEEGAIGSLSATAMVKYPDDFYLSDQAAAGDRLTIKLRNTTAGAIVVTFSIRITPL